MSGYPDDRYDDRPDDGYDDRRRGPGVVERGRAAVRVPAVLLIVIGALCLLAAIINLISLPGLPAQLDQMIANLDNDPNMPEADKQKWKDMIGQVKDMTNGPTFWIAYVVSALVGLVILIGGVKMMNLSGKGLPMLSAILAMIPCTSGCCCILGLPVGIWALVALGKPEVNAALAALRSGNPDDQYMR